jgi:hypothetical protein
LGIILEIVEFVLEIEEMMTIQETLSTAKFVVNDKGERTAVYLPVEAWDTLVEWVNQQNHDITEPKPVRLLEELFGDFWPEDEPVDTFIEVVRQWRRDDLVLHRELS